MVMLIVLSTCPDRKTADNIAKTLVEKHLAACVNIIALEDSVYRWKGKIVSEEEYLLIIKTTKTQYSGLETVIKDSHPYEVPEIIAINVTKGNRKYIEWVENCCKTRNLTR